MRRVRVARRSGGAEDALAVLGPGDVLDAPRRPQRSLGHERATLPSVFHVELRQFPHQARAFNLTREELDERILVPGLAGERDRAERPALVARPGEADHLRGAGARRRPAGARAGVAERDPQREDVTAGGAGRAGASGQPATGRGFKRRCATRRLAGAISSPALGRARRRALPAVAGERADRAVRAESCGSCCTRVPSRCPAR